jgi:NTP pyrophosphatase (non-canonical NTP hydrolase)
MLQALRIANVIRQKEWAGDVVLDASFAGNELAGEVGEACNVVKKLERQRLGIKSTEETVEHLAEELADIVICVDLLAMKYGIDLAAAVPSKFNQTSHKMGLNTFMEIA